MPRDLTTAFLEKSAAKEHALVYLYTVHDCNGAGDDLRFAGWTQNVTFDGLLYTKFPVSHEDIGEQAAGEIDSVRITLGNVSRLVQSYLELYEWRGLKVTITTVWADLLADPTAKLVDIYYIDDLASDVKHVTVSCTSKLDVLEVKLPLRRHSRLVCQWVIFKGSECGYPGSQLTCNRTWQRCGELNNRARFGGKPSTPYQRTIVR